MSWPFPNSCDRMTPRAVSRVHWNRLKFPNKPPLR
jgi:hypothetical protein